MFAATAVAVLGFGLAPSNASAQAVTTATLAGRVTSDAGAPLPGVQIVVRNLSTGTQQGTITRSDGRYLVAALRPGGPYVVEARLLGYGSETVADVQLALGQTRAIDFALGEQAVALEGIEVTVEGSSSRSDGISTVVSETAVENAPTVGRELADLIRFTPQVVVLNESPDGAAISIAGQSNRNNALFIDGVVQSDAFGLAAQGTNGGQTGAPPISFDAIDQMQIAISPFDVTQSGFVGGAINVVTRSGTNDLSGSLYYQFRNDDLTGETPGDDAQFGAGRERQPVPDFTTQRYGFRLGGPILQDKLFFFLNGELFRSETPQLFSFTGYEGNLTESDITGLRQILRDEVGYEAGGFLERASTLDDNKLLGKVDWQINDDHRLWVRHSYSGSDNVEASTADADDLYFDNASEVFPSSTNATAAELTSRFGDRFVNKLVLGATFVRDDRNFAGTRFPRVTIEDAGADIQLGAEPFSTGNVLNQDIFSLTNNLSVFLGSHTLTLGTHNEFYRIKNLFLRENFGNYTYRSVGDFLRSVCAAGSGQSAYCQQLRQELGGTITPAEPSRYARGYSQLTNNLGDEASEVAAEFDAYQLGLYVQDEFPVGDRLRLTAGVRFELPGFGDDPRGPTDFEATTMPLLDQYGISLDGARVGQAPDPQLIVAPRLGFSYDLADAGAQVRGGVGIFNGRQQFVYPGAMYTNNAVTLGYYNRTRFSDGRPIPFVPDPSQAPGIAEFGASRGELDLFEDGFEYPRVLRTSLGFDARLPFGFTGTLEGQYTKTLAGLTVENLNFKPLNARLVGPDNREVYNYGFNSRFGSFDVGQTVLDPRYSHILKVGNTDEGYAYDISGSLNRAFGENLVAHVSYTFGDAYSINDLTSSQIYSIWRFNPNISGLNNLELGRSNYSIGHRALAQVTYTQEFLERLGTTVSMVYTGESGRPYSLLVGNNFGFSGEGSGTSPLAFIPQDAGDLQFVDYTVGSGDNRRTVTAAEQIAAFSSLIQNNEYLSERRGDYAERNALRAPFEHVVDLKLAQELFANLGGRRNTVELTLDILNFTNLLNSEWGQRYDVGFRTVDLVRFERFNSATDLTPQYTFRLQDAEGDLAASLDDYWDNRLIDFGGFGSRWQMQIGARYTF